MKYITVPILCLLILAQTFSKWIILADYSINREFIINNLCVNKSKPVTQCHGKCQLSKKMASDNGNNKEANGIVKEKSTEVLYFENMAVGDSGFEKLPEQTRPGYFTHLHASPTFDIFHPPC